MPSHLLDYLPAIYQTDAFIGEFLLAFEKVLIGHKDDVSFCYKDGKLVGRNEISDPDSCYEGLEQTIAKLATFFDPQTTPEEFLSWLADWTALSLRADLQPQSKRRFIANIVQRYRYRGTKANLQKLLELFLTTGTPTVVETEVAYRFEVKVTLPRVDARELGRQLDIAHTIIELEKPAHTDYKLDPRFPTMRVGDPEKPDEPGSRLGIDTLLGTIPGETSASNNSNIS